MDRNILPMLIDQLDRESPPARVAWIETSRYSFQTRPPEVATREGGVDRNTTEDWKLAEKIASPPARVAWIETYVRWGNEHIRTVATREGGVDRNFWLSASIR